jgi:hypothetical protein
MQARCYWQIAPLLDATRRTRAASLGHEPPTADALDQRSIVIAPLTVQQRLLGYMYADIDGAFRPLSTTPTATF